MRLHNVAVTLLLATISFSSLFLSAVDAYKVLIFVPGLSNSQLIFNHAVAEALANRGHDVTIYRAIYLSKANKPKPNNVKEITAKALLDDSVFVKQLDSMNVFQSASSFNWSVVSFFKELMPQACETQLANKELMDKLKAGNFDIAFGHMYDLCPLGIIKALKIPTYIWMSSGTLMDYMAGLVGAPTVPSYVPHGFTRSGDRMDFMERAINLFAHSITLPLYNYVVGEPETAMFRKHFGQDFPHLFQIASESPLVFVNTEELLEFPRPIFHKIVYIGGLGMKAPKPLNGEWEKIVNSNTAKKGVIVLSFGSVAPTTHVPELFRRSIASVFKRVPDHLFIVKWDGEFPEAAGLPNVVIKSWIPQKDLVGHPKAKLLITHGGLNSILESVNAGCPLVVIPLFGDQMGNLKRVQRANVGLGLYKEDVTEVRLSKVVKTVLENSSYEENAKLLSRMIKKKPISSEDLLVKWTEFLAEFKTIPNFQPVSTELGTVQYFSLDAIWLGFLVFSIALWLSYKIVAVYIWSCFGGMHQRRKEKQT